MKKQLAQKALERMRQAGIATGGRARFGSFAEAKRLTKNFAAMVRHDVDAADPQIKGAFYSVASPGSVHSFRGWLPLLAWLDTVEALLTEMVKGEVK